MVVDGKNLVNSLALSPLLLCADAGVEIGNGHVMRCLAIAEAWRARGGDTFLLSKNFPPSLQRNIGRTKTNLLEYPEKEAVIAIPESASKIGAKWIVIDGYHFSQDTIDGVARRAAVLQVSDSAQIPQTKANILLNPNIHAQDMTPAFENGPALLCGARFALLRGDARCIPNLPPVTPAKNLLITFGGSDPCNHTEMALEAISANSISKVLKIRVIVGGNNPHKENIANAISRFSLDAEIHENVARMGEHYHWADAALISASTTFLEACAAALPSIVVQTAENQAPILEAVRKSEVAYALSASTPWKDKLFTERFTNLCGSKTERLRIATAMKALVDGQGAERVAAAMAAHCFRFRPAKMEDSEEILRWSNDPETRKASFSGEFIQRQTHEKWLAEKISSSDSLMLIAETEDNIPFAICRFDRDAAERFIISINFAPEYRTLGLGVPVLRAATENASVVLNGGVIRAFIKQENLRSLKTFTRAGYLHDEASDSQTACMEWRRK